MTSAVFGNRSADLYQNIGWFDQTAADLNQTIGRFMRQPWSYLPSIIHPKWYVEFIDISYWKNFFPL